MFKISLSAGRQAELQTAIYQPFDNPKNLMISKLIFMDFENRRINDHGICIRNSFKFRPILDEEIPQSSIASCGL